MLYLNLCCLWALYYVWAFSWQMTTVCNKIIFWHLNGYNSAFHPNCTSNLSFTSINLSGNYSRYRRPSMTWRLTLRLMTASSFAFSSLRNQSYEKLEKFLREFTEENSTNVLVKPDLKTRGFSKEWVLQGRSTFKMNYKILFVPFCAYTVNFE